MSRSGVVPCLGSGTSPPATRCFAHYYIPQGMSDCRFWPDPRRPDQAETGMSTCWLRPEDIPLAAWEPSGDVHLPAGSRPKLQSDILSAAEEAGEAPATTTVLAAVSLACG
ncbi:hypothetical protein MDA_GLEAN10013353 [Myotis davidii]|uniref:Uncharacterized protein n=1 Tax=Myotis davidii TaxID=225400 RepID=L5LDW0_MYODS|nr:hypothetical protein MDA_GLEAN10013353 [Myotis davidii]